MSQHDYVIANASGASVRSDLNDALAAVATWNSGSSAPGTTYARMRWVDTTNGVVKRRNAANSAWIVVETDDESFVLSRSSNTMVDLSDKGKTIRATGSYTQTFDAVATLGDGWWVGFRVESGATLTLDPNSSETIDGGTTLAIAGPASGFVVGNGSALYTVGYAPPSTAGITLGTEQATTSGTSIDFTGIPSGTKRITINLVGVSTNGAANMLLQLGDAGGMETSGYLGASSHVGSGGTGAANYTTGFGLNNTGSATVQGTITLTLQDAAAFQWCCTGVVGDSPSAFSTMVGGTKALSAELTQLRFTTTNGTDAFDAGAINITWE